MSVTYYIPRRIVLWEKAQWATSLGLDGRVQGEGVGYIPVFTSVEALREVFPDAEWDELYSPPRTQEGEG